MEKKQHIRGAYGIVLLALFWANSLCATSLVQTDTSKVLPAFKVLGLRYPSFFAGSKFQLLDSTILLHFQQQSLAQVLGSQSQVFIKSYGPAALATASFRGGNANHTPVLWNGFAMQSPLNGQTDLALIPSFLLEGIALQYGSPAALFGSGAIGGSIHLQTQNKLLEGHHVKLMAGLGSFGTHTLGAKVQLQYGKWKSNFGFYRQQGLNDFRFHKANLLQPGEIQIAPEVSRANHANFKQHAYLQEVEGKLGKYHELGVRLWWQEAQRNLPEFSLNPMANATQHDKQLRLMGEYKFKKQQYELQSRTGFFKDDIVYNDLLNGLSQTKGHQLTQFIDQFWHGKKFEWLLSGMVQKLNGEGNLFQNGNNFSFIQWQDRQAIFGSIKHQNFNGKLQQQLSLRSEWVNGKRVPLMPSCGLQLFIHKSLTVLGNASSSYRLPTFNDLYWPQMGNPFLKPEQGMSFELSLKNNTTFFKKFVLNQTLTAYHKEISNWILWVPVSGNLSKPFNLHAVESKGIEWQWQFNLSVGKSKFQLGGLLDITQAMPIRSTLYADSSINKQLIFTPRIKQQIQAGFSRGSLNALYTWNYVGNRFTSSDNQNWLAPYQLHSLAASYGFKVKQHLFTIQASLQNLFNQTYQIMVNRPMPLRNFQLTLQYQL
jgi:iron complex outermembrane receptor protein